MFHPKKLIFASLISTISLSIYAAPTHILIAPSCLLKNTSVPYEKLSTVNSLNLIKIQESEIESLSEARHRSKTPCGGFFDVTADYAEAKKDAASFLRDRSMQSMHTSKEDKDYVVKHSTTVNTLLDQINPTLMWNNLAVLSSFKDRYSNSDNGVKAAHWLKQQVETIAQENHRTDVTAYFVETGFYYKQPSLVVKLGDGKEPGIVIGGHMDTLSSSRDVKPGADDDGSGSVTVLETARTIMSSGMHFKKPIYFIWYAAEEMGLVGSSYVVKDFKAKKIPVDAVIQMDMTGYAYKNDQTMWLITDHVDSKLTNYLETLINTYIKQPVKRTACGYGCSDHASWDQAGFAASMPAEAAFENTNPVLHTSNDTMDKLSLAHMTDYVKLGVAFVVELAEPVK